MSNDLFVLQATPAVVKGKTFPYLFDNGVSFDPAKPYVHNYFLECLGEEDQSGDNLVHMGLRKALKLSQVRDQQIFMPKPQLKGLSYPEQPIYPDELLELWADFPEDVEVQIHALLPQKPKMFVLNLASDEGFRRAAYIHAVCEQHGLDMGLVATRQVGDVWLEAGSRLLFLHSGTGAVLAYDSVVFEWFLKFTAHGK